MRMALCEKDELSLENGTTLSPTQWQTLGQQSSISRYLKTWVGQPGLEQVPSWDVIGQNLPSNLESSWLMDHRLAQVTMEVRRSGCTIQGQAGEIHHQILSWV